VLREIVGRAALADTVADKPYEIRYCAESDLYFQTWVMSAVELGAWYSPPTDASFFMAEIGKQRLHWFAHQTEEILVLRQFLQAGVCHFGTSQFESGAVLEGGQFLHVQVRHLGDCQISSFNPESVNLV
jgi:hypothetical protein